MKAYLVERPARDWCQDYAMVIIAEDELHAERKARVSSDDFKKCQEITITEIDMNEEQCVLTANTGEEESNHMEQLIDKTVLQKELSTLQSEMGFVRKSDVMQILDSQKCAYNIKEEKNKMLDKVLKACDIECGLYSGDVKNLTRHVLMRVLDGLRE